MNQNDKRTAVCRLSFLPLSLAEVDDMPGTGTIKIQGSFTPIPIASGEFRETETDGNLIEQELEAVVTDTECTRLAEMRQLLSQEGFVLLTFTNQDRRVVGSMDFPVKITAELGGTPQALTLSFRRNSPEPAKIYSSF